MVLEMESIPGKDAVKTAEMNTEDLEYYVNLAGKAVAEFERIDSSLEVLLWVKCYETASCGTENHS